MLARLGLILLTPGDRYDYNAKAAEREAGRAELSWLSQRKIFNLLLLLMARGRTKDGLCIVGVYSPHPSNSPPRCLRDWNPNAFFCGKGIFLCGVEQRLCRCSTPHVSFPPPAYEG
jgi:hypothetical protein